MYTIQPEVVQPCNRRHFNFHFLGGRKTLFSQQMEVKASINNHDFQQNPTTYKKPATMSDKGFDIDRGE